MNQLMTIERTERAHRTPALRSRDNPSADTACDEVAVAALRRFRSCHNFEIRQVICDVRQGVLIIRGQVSSYYLKQLAQETVRTLTGVDRIINRLEVVYDRTIKPSPMNDSRPKRENRTAGTVRFRRSENK